MTAAADAMTAPLRLRVADTFSKRLLGLHAGRSLAPDEGLLLVPCRAVHTFFMRRAIDVVFIDARGGVRSCIHAVSPWRMVADPHARMVLELPAGYCRSHPDYPQRIHAALQLRVSPRLPV